MSLTLVNVTLSNIRHHRFFSFSPAGSGVTAIRGATGSGKSSIVDSVAWVLYGVKPKGVAKNASIMNDKATWGEDRFYASVVLLVDNVFMKVERRIVSEKGATECDVWEVPVPWLNDSDSDETLHKDSTVGEENTAATETDAASMGTNDDNDGEGSSWSPGVVSVPEGFFDELSEDELTITFDRSHHVAGAATSNSESYIRNRLKMDAKGFLAAVLVQQKQVDSLVLSSASERASVIEKLTGISAATVALKKSREELNEIRRTISSFDTGDEDLPALEKSIEEINCSVEKILKKIDSLSKRKKSCENGIADRQKEYETLSSLFLQGEKIRREIENKRSSLSELKKTLQEMITEKDNLKSSLGGSVSKSVNSVSKSVNVGDEENVASLERKYDKGLERLNSIKRALDRAENSRRLEGRNILDTLTLWERSLDRLKDSEIEDIFSVALESLRAAYKLDDYTGSSEDLKEKLQPVEYFSSRVKKAIDKENRAIESLKKKSFSSMSEAQKNRRAIKVLQEGQGCCPTCLQKVDDMDPVVKTLSESAESLENKAKEYEDRITVKQGKVEVYLSYSDATDKIVESASSLYESMTNSDTSAGKIAEYKERIAKGEKYVSQVKDSLEHERRLEDLRAKYQDALSRAQKVSKRIEDATSSIDLLKNQLKSMNIPSQSTITRIQSMIEKDSDSLSGVKENIIQLTGEKDVLTERRMSFEKDATRIRENTKKYKSLLEESERAAQASHVVERFREVRIENSVPMIESYASDLISRFTNGKFVRMSLDKKFNATVVLSDGRKRPVGMLSGGELSAAAIALRVAISMLLNGGGSRSLIVLDEVLVSQDHNSAESIIETIKEVCQGQVIIIAHNDSVDEYSDKVVEIETQAS